jgi:hypothetical protein
MIKKPQNHWDEIKIEIGRNSNIIDIIKDLYELSDQNKYFLEARFLDFSINTIEPYKKIIIKALNPDITRNESLFIDKAQDAVSGYRKSTNNFNGTMELAFLFLNEAINFCEEYGYREEDIECAMLDVFEIAINILKENPDKVDGYYPKIKKMQCRVEEIIGYDVETSIEDLFY